MVYNFKACDVGFLSPFPWKNINLRSLDSHKWTLYEQTFTKFYFTTASSVSRLDQSS